MDSPALGAPPEGLLPLKDVVAPLALTLGGKGGGCGGGGADVVDRPDAVAADDVGEDLHPLLLLARVVGIEVNDLTVVKADAEALLDEHVTLFLLGEGRPPPLAISARRLPLRKGAAVVYQPLGVTEVDGGAGLPGGLVVGRQLGAY